MKRKLKRYAPLPVIQQYGPFDPPEIRSFRKEGLVCMGPYANDKWYIFHPRPRPLAMQVRAFFKQFI